MPKTTPGSQNNVDASKPIPNKNTESCGQKMRYKKNNFLLCTIRKLNPKKTS